MPKNVRRSYGGRLAKDPMTRIGLPIRALVTPPVRDALFGLGKELGLSPSDILRLAVFELLERKGKGGKNLRQDDSFTNLRGAGLV